MTGITKTETLSLTAAYAIGYSGLVALPLWIGAVIDQLQLETWFAGLLGSIYLFSVFTGTIVLAAVIERFDKKRITLAGLIAAASGFAVVAATSSIPVIILGLIVAGLGLSGALGAASATAASTPNPQSTFSTFVLGIAIYIALFYLIAPSLLTRFGFSAIFLTLIASIVAVAGAVYAWYPKPRKADAHDGDATSGAGLFAATAALFILAGIGVFYVAQSAFWGFIERIGKASGLGIETIGLVLSLSSFISIAAPIIAAKLGDRFGALRTLLISIALVAAISIVLALFAAPVVFVGGAVLFVCVCLFLMPYALSILASVDQTGRASVAAPGVIMIGNSLGPLFAGLIVTVWGLPLLGFAALPAFAIACLLFFVGSRRSIVGAEDLQAAAVSRSASAEETM